MLFWCLRTGDDITKDITNDTRELSVVGQV